MSRVLSMSRISSTTMTSLMGSVRTRYRMPGRVPIARFTICSSGTVFVRPVITVKVRLANGTGYSQTLYLSNLFLISLSADIRCSAIRLLHDKLTMTLSFKWSRQDWYKCLATLQTCPNLRFVSCADLRLTSKSARSRDAQSVKVEFRMKLASVGWANKRQPMGWESWTRKRGTNGI